MQSMWVTLCLPNDRWRRTRVWRPPRRRRLATHASSIAWSSGAQRSVVRDRWDFSFCLSLFVYLTVCLLISLSVFLSLRCLLLCLLHSLCLSLSVSLSLSLSLSLCLSLSVSFSLSLSLSLSLSPPSCLSPHPIFSFFVPHPVSFSLD